MIFVHFTTDAFAETEGLTSGEAAFAKGTFGGAGAGTFSLSPQIQTLTGKKLG